MTHQDNSRGKRSARGRRVIELYEAGVPCSQINAEVGVSVARIYHWCNRYADKDKRRQAKAEQRKVKAEQRKVKAEQRKGKAEQRKAQHVREAIEQRSARIKRVIELYEAGAHRAQIADEVGISITTVLKWGRQYGDKDKRRHAKAEQRRQAKAEAAQRKREAKAEHRHKKIADAVWRYERGELVEIIAERHSVTRSTVSHWCSRYADKDKRRQAKAEQKQLWLEAIREKNAPLNERVQRFIELYESGAHPSQITSDVGICRATLYQWAKVYGADKDKRKINVREQQTLRVTPRVVDAVHRYEQGESVEAIAARHGVCVVTVYRWCNRYADKDKREQAKAEQRKER